MRNKIRRIALFIAGMWLPMLLVLGFALAHTSPDKASGSIAFVNVPTSTTPVVISGAYTSCTPQRQRGDRAIPTHQKCELTVAGHPLELTTTDEWNSCQARYGSEPVGCQSEQIFYITPPIEVRLLDGLGLNFSQRQRLRWQNWYLQPIWQTALLLGLPLLLSVAIFAIVMTHSPAHLRSQTRRRQVAYSIFQFFMSVFISTIVFLSVTGTIVLLLTDGIGFVSVLPD